MARQSNYKSPDRNILLELHEKRRSEFLENIGYENMRNMNVISKDNNQYLYPLHRIYMQKIQNMENGVFIADIKGIYVPIENGGYGVVHVERIPLGKPAVYGLTDISHSAYIEVNGQIIIYVGVKRTEKFGFLPINDNSHIKPILSLSFPNPQRLLMVKEGTKLIEYQQDNSDEEYGEYES
jgi:hypothetical protein